MCLDLLACAEHSFWKGPTEAGISSSLAHPWWGGGGDRSGTGQKGVRQGEAGEGRLPVRLFMHFAGRTT